MAQAGGGKHQILDNGNRLITEARAGRVFEIDPGGTVERFGTYLSDLPRRSRELAASDRAFERLAVLGRAEALQPARHLLAQRLRLRSPFVAHSAQSIEIGRFVGTIQACCQ